LTQAASEHFPKKYDKLINLLLTEMENHLSSSDIEQMLHNIGKQLAAEADIPPSMDLETRLASVVEYLNSQGYLARWEPNGPGQYLIHIANCPFEKVSGKHPKVCEIDATLLTQLLGAPPRRIARTKQSDRQCTYLVTPAVSA
jgi:predicted ArsR family transcriptional regulator